MNSNALNNRLDHLDAVRAFALLLGVVFHASMSFMPMYIGWAVMDVSTSPVVAQFALVSHSFRMELFFLIAGFFSHMTFHRNGAGGFIRSRFVRIAIPFVVGWFLLKPLIVSGWVMGQASLSGEVDILSGLMSGVQSLQGLPTGMLTGSHLWFLYYLLLITTIVLILRFGLRLNTRLHAAVACRVDTTVRWIANSRFSLVVLSVLTAACLWFMNIWGMETPDKSLAPNWPVLCVYGGFFALGWLLHRQDGLLEQFGRLTVMRGVLVLFSVAVTILLSGYQANMGHPHIEWIRVGFLFGYAMMMWSLVCLSMGAFRTLLDRPNRLVRYLADSSYWLYLIHLPIVIWLQIAVAELPFHWSLKLVAISLLTVGISLVLYDLFVRSTLIGKLLNGCRKERVLFRCGVRTGGGKEPAIAEVAG